MAEQLDWGWSDKGYKRRRKALLQVRLPKAITVPGNGTVSSQAARHVLRLLNDHAGGDCETFVGQTTLADESGLSLSQVKRALTALRLLGVIRCVKKRGRASIVLNHYIIEWEEVRRRGRDVVHPEVTESALPRAVEPHSPSDSPSGAIVHYGTTLAERRSIVDRASFHSGPSVVPSWTERCSIVDHDYVSDNVLTTSSTTGDGWATAAARLVQLGVRVPWRAIDSARRRGSTPARVIALADHFERGRHQAGWENWALFTRVRDDGPGVDIADGWPAPPPIRSPPPDPRQVQATLEASHGRELDALSADELQDFARRHLSGNATLWTMWTMAGIRAPEVRQALLAVLAQQEVAT